MLRARFRRLWRKPLIVFTPKHAAPSRRDLELKRITQPRFKRSFALRKSRTPANLMASGKVGHELKTERRRRKDSSTLSCSWISFIRCASGNCLCLCRNRMHEKSSGFRKPRNMGPYFYVVPRLESLASPPAATALRKAFSKRQPRHWFGQGARDGAKTLLSLAFTTTTAADKRTQRAFFLQPTRKTFNTPFTFM